MSSSNSINNDILLNEIKIWENETNPKLIEIGLFKIYVRFERFLYDAFVNYSIGNASKYGFCPARRLVFQDEIHFKNIFNFTEKAYLDFGLKEIMKISPSIFEPNQNPFEASYNDTDFLKKYNQLKLIRNYLAHLSAESQEKYKTSVLGAYNIVPITIEPHEFLIRKPSNSSETYYKHYINLLKQHSELILKPIS